MIEEDLDIALEKRLEESQPKYTDREWLNIFPEFKEMIPDKIKELAIERDIVVKEANRKISLIEKHGQTSLGRWFYGEWVRTNEVETVKRLTLEIKRFEWLKYLAGTKEKSKFEEKVLLAREYPILDLVLKHVILKKHGKDWFGLCPFRKEKTPSFSVITKDNFFYCFGCQESGSGIDFIMKIEELSFRRAVERIAIG